MKNLGFLPTRDSFGSKDIGDQWATITSGCGDIGSVLRLKGRAGRIRITTTTEKAGNGTKDIGAVKTTTTDIGGNMNIGGDITDMKMMTVTSRWR